MHDRIFRPYNYLGKDNDIELICAWNQLPNQELGLSYLKDVKSKRIGKAWTKVKWLRKHWEVPCFGHSHTDTHKRPVRNITQYICLTCYMCIFRPQIIVYCMWRRITTSFFF